VINLTVGYTQYCEMAALIRISSNCELRLVIQFFTAKGQNATQIHKELREVCGDSCMSLPKRFVDGCAEFSNGRNHVHDETMMRERR